MNKVKVLVTGSGGAVGQGIIKALRMKTDDIKYEIIAVDMNPLSSGLYRADKGYIVPPANEVSYIKTIISICNREKINVVLPGSDPELIPLAQSKDEIYDNTGAQVIISDAKVVKTARDKWLTYQFLKKNGLPYPSTVLPSNLNEFLKDVSFPILVKPRQGFASRNVFIIYDRDDINYAIKAIERSGWSPIIQEYIPEDEGEFTTGVLISKEGEVLSSISMRRTLKAGSSYRIFVDDFKHLRNFAEEVAKKLRARGPINVQCRVHNDKPIIFEINPRFSGTAIIRAVAGINEPVIIIRNYMLGERKKVNTYKKLIGMRYWNEVYIKFSDYSRLADKKLITKCGVVIDYL